MIIQFGLSVLELIERSSEELAKEKDVKNAPKFTGSAAIKRTKRLKSGQSITLEDVISFKSFEKLNVGECIVEAEISAYSINGNSGLSVRVLRSVKTKGQAAS